MDGSLQDNFGHQEEEVIESRGNLVVETEGILRETAKKLFSLYHLNKGHRTRLGVGKKKHGNVFKVTA